jgi:hypothetical protein
MVWLMWQATCLITTATKRKGEGAVSKLLAQESKDYALCCMFSHANVQWPDESVFLYKWHNFP